MSGNLRIRCRGCSHCNRVPVDKIMVEQNSPYPRVQVFISMYEPMQVPKCEKCGKIIAQLKELIRIVKKS
jgi:hypothetical protein